MCLALGKNGKNNHCHENLNFFEKTQNFSDLFVKRVLKFTPNKVVKKRY